MVEMRRRGRLEAVGRSVLTGGPRAGRLALHVGLASLA
jgi:hypothetical protein